VVDLGLGGPRQGWAEKVALWLRQHIQQTVIRSSLEMENADQGYVPETTASLT